MNFQSKEYCLISFINTAGEWIVRNIKNPELVTILRNSLSEMKNAIYQHKKG